MRRRGYTLPELLIAGALFIALSAMAGYGIMMGIRAGEYDRNLREAETTARDVLNRLVDEMRTAAVLPAVSLGTDQMPSGVLYPDSYGAGSPFGGSLYTTGTTGSGAYFSTNRVIFSRPGTSSAGAAFNPSDLSAYVYVEWVIPPSPSNGSAPWNRIYRKVHNVGITSPGHTFNGGRWLIQPNYFTNGSGLRSSTEESWIVGKLRGSDDILEMTVEHPAYINPVTGMPGVESGYNTSYDRNLFKVTVKTTTFRRGDNNTIPGAKKTVRTLEAQVRIQSGI